MNDSGAGARGVAKMLGWTEELPGQLVEAVSSARLQAWPIPSARGLPAERATRVIMGMGGSGAAGRLAASLLGSRLTGPAVFVGDDALPEWAGPRTQSLVVSYSGSTWEALAAWESGAQREVPVSAVTSGGVLQSRAHAEGRPCFLVPSGYPPRAAVGWMLVPIALWLAGDAASECATELTAAGRRLASALARGLLGADPRELGQSMAGRAVHIYAATEQSAVLASRWAAQLAENAKQMTQIACFPELAHNVVEAWGPPLAPPAREDEGSVPLCLVLEPSPAEGPRGGSIGAVLDEVRRAGAEVRRISPPQGSAIDRMLALLLLGDLASIFCAEARGVDPSGIPALERVKAAVQR